MFRNSRVQPNGLQEVYLGEFEQDPLGDYMIDVVEKFNHNVKVEDVALGDLKRLQERMGVLAARGLLDGYLNGGVCGQPLVNAEDAALTITKMFVTPIEFFGVEPTAPDIDLDPLPVDLDPLPPPTPPEVPYCPGIQLQALYTDPAVSLPQIEQSSVLEVLTEDEETIL